MGDQEDITKEFLLESYEGLDTLERDLMSYEKNPSNKEQLNNIFRVLHTIKGTAGFLGFTHLPHMAHVGENVLNLLRNDKIKLHSELTSSLLSLVDSLRQIMNHVENHQVEGDADFTAVVDKLNRAAAKTPEDAPAPAPLPSANPLPEETESRSHQLEDTAIRVDVTLLDRLMNVTGELVLARNQALQIAAAENDFQWASRLQPLNDLTLKIQEDVMKARLQPVSNLWNRFPRLMRDMAEACQKKVRLEMQGADTEIDKSILESIRDPLTHLIRNCIDHGIEKPDARVAAGKNPEGLLILRAFHEAGMVQIELTDDGAGLDIAKIKAKALKEGMITAQQAAELSQEAAIRLIFRPGFSTAKEVTQFSGRGVGMDVVKTNIEKTGGKVEVVTQPGWGTTFRIKIPLTLAIIPALSIHCGGQRFIVPRVHLRELIQLKEEQIQKNIEYIHQVPVYRLRGKLLPLVHLSEELKLAKNPEPPKSLFIAVLKVDEHLFGLVMDAVGDFQEVVVKPLGSHLKNIPLYSGTTILGDGKVALILDILGLAQKSRVLTENTEGLALAVEEEEVRSAVATQMFLIFQTPDDGRMAMPMEKITRLETFQPQSVEKNGSSSVVQYEGRILSLIYVSSLLAERRTQLRTQAVSKSGAEKLNVVVCGNDGSEIGLVVDQILDIVETPALEVLRPATRPGVRGSVILKDRVTELLDLPGLVTLSGAPVIEDNLNSKEDFQGLGLA